jgi:hypothetical protein
MDKKKQNVSAYISTWNEVDEATIEQKLASCVSTDANYSDPFTDPVQGLGAFVQVMVGVGRSFPGVTHELVGEPDIHHNFGYYHWLARLSGGKEIRGLDYIEFGSDDAITKVISFTDTSDWQ